MVDYDAVMSGGWSHRVRSFAGYTADDKAEFIREHRQRWLAANRSRLSPAQVSSMEEQITFITQEIYRQPMDPDLYRKSKDLEARVVEIFLPSDIYQLTLHGDRVPEVV